MFIWGLEHTCFSSSSCPCRLSVRQSLPFKAVTILTSANDEGGTYYKRQHTHVYQQQQLLSLFLSLFCSSLEGGRRVLNCVDDASSHHHQPNNKMCGQKNGDSFTDALPFILLIVFFFKMTHTRVPPLHPTQIIALVLPLVLFVRLKISLCLLLLFSLTLYLHSNTTFTHWPTRRNCTLITLSWLTLRKC